MKGILHFCTINIKCDEIVTILIIWWNSNPVTAYIVPEISSLAMLVLGLIGIAGVRRKLKN